MKPDPWKLKALIEMSPQKTKEELQAFLGIIDYINSLLTIWHIWITKTADIKQNIIDLDATYQKLFDKAKSIIKEDTYMKFYDLTQPLYLETDTCGLRLGDALLQTRNGRDKASDNSILRTTAFMTKSQTSAEKRYSNMERGTMNITWAEQVPSLQLSQRGDMFKIWFYWMVLNIPSLKGSVIED